MAALCGCLLAAAWAGWASLSARGAWNLAGIAGACLALALVLAPAGENPPVSQRDFRWLIPVAVAAAFLPFLDVPFLSDDFLFAEYGRTMTPSFAWYSFTHAGGDGFYRPVAYSWLGVQGLWAGDSMMRWKLLQILMHGLNSGLLFLVARRLGFAPAPASFAALLFALHGTRSEAVVWLAGAFDQLSTALIFCALLLLESHAWLALILMALAQYTKEPAYAFPLLAAVWLWARGNLRDQWRRLIPFAALTVVLLGWRMWLLGGIGGYHATGGSQFLAFGPVDALKVFAWRLWAVLFFPVNASRLPGFQIAIPLLAALAALVYAIWRARRTKAVMTGFAFLLASCLLPAHLLLIGPDLQKSRLLYLPIAGFAILLAAAFASLPRRAWRLCAAAVLVFQTAAILNNNRIYADVGFLAQRACAQAARCPPGDSLPALPAVVDGVYFLGNGFAQCVARVTGRPHTPAAEWIPAQRRLACLSATSPSAPAPAESPEKAKD
jgi:hypothetical protein